MRKVIRLLQGNRRREKRGDLFLNALIPFDRMATEGGCDSCERPTLCMVFQVQGSKTVYVQLCIECLIDYAKHLSKLARGHDTIDDLL